MAVNRIINYRHRRQDSVSAMSQMQNFACPSCGGSLTYSSPAPTLVCCYCGNAAAGVDAAGRRVPFPQP